MFYVLGILTGLLIAVLVHLSTLKYNSSTLPTRLKGKLEKLFSSKATIVDMSDPVRDIDLGNE